MKTVESASALRQSYLGLGRECFVGVNIDNQSKLLYDTMAIGDFQLQYTFDNVLSESGIIQHHNRMYCNKKSKT